MKKQLKNVENFNQWGGVKSKKQNNDSSVIREKDWYREKIIEMTKQIKNQRFLKAIYISISDYIKENEPE